jgi:Alpha amylase, catalytic domain
MSNWPPYPAIHEINTWVWLSELAGKTGASADLGSVPAAEWDRLAALGVDGVWLMGVWERSPAGIAIANRNEGLLADFKRALPDFRTGDNVGSPYCVRRYVVDQHLGGAKGLARARKELAKRGVRLILDFVPNHVAPDHPWVGEHPEYFIHGTPEDARNNPAAFITRDGIVYACGRDPFFPAWPDVVQLNAFEPRLRAAVRETLSEIADQCDGVRCDMAMLLLNDIFERTWGGRTGPKPETEYWSEVIPATKKSHPGFLFMAEAYWDLEWELQQKGFDFCYDKKLYDRLEHDSAEQVRLHLCADPAYQNRLVRFIENHDEPRAATAFPGPKEKAAAVVSSTLPGARLFHEGQFDGHHVRLPVFLSRTPAEAPDAELESFYAKLLPVATSPALREGRWKLCDRSGWPDNPSYQNLVAWCWEKDDERYLIVVNLSEGPAQGQVRVGWDGVTGQSWNLTDKITGRTFDRSGDDLASGLYVDLGPWNSHLFECRRRNVS